VRRELGKLGWLVRTFVVWGADGADT
jgi:hypothetical protein